MQTNDPQRAKRSDLQGNNDQSFDDANGGVEHGRDVSASLTGRSEPRVPPEVYKAVSGYYPGLPTGRS